MEIIKYVTEQALVLIPVLYIIGLIIKNTEKVADKYIPVLLLPCGILGAIGILGLSADAIIQGVLIVGATTFTNQLIKQIQK